MQNVVFNSHYLAYVDDAMSHWMRSVGYDYGVDGFDFMVRHAEVDWRGSATYGDTLQIDCAVQRWGSTSFDVRFDIKVREQTVVEIVHHVCRYRSGTRRPRRSFRDGFRTALSPTPP